MWDDHPQYGKFRPWHTCNPNGAPCFDCKRPCFEGLTFKNRGHLKIWVQDHLRYYEPDAPEVATARPTMQPSCCDATAAYLSNSFSASICDIGGAMSGRQGWCNLRSYLEPQNPQNHRVVITVRVVEQEGCSTVLYFVANFDLFCV